MDNDARVIVDEFIFVMICLTLFKLLIIVLLVFLPASASAVRMHFLHDVFLAVGVDTFALGCVFFG